MDKFYHKNQKAAVNSVKKFYNRNDIAKPDKHGLLDITISLDAAYGRRGHESTHCFSSAIDPWTSTLIDHVVAEKYFLCQNHNTPNTFCVHGLFHGPSGNMEPHNALILFKRSVEKFGIR